MVDGRDDVGKRLKKLESDHKKLISELDALKKAFARVQQELKSVSVKSRRVWQRFG